MESRYTKLKQPVTVPGFAAPTADPPSGRKSEVKWMESRYTKLKQPVTVPGFEDLDGGNDDKEVFNLNADDWRETSEAKYYFLAPDPAGSAVRVVNLPLNHNADGAKVTVMAVYARDFWTSKDWRKATADLQPPKSDQEVTLDEFKFKIASFKINQINFHSSRQLFSGLADTELPEVEWIKYKRDNIPTSERWGDSVSAPTFVTSGNILSLKVHFDCSGLSEATLLASCVNITGQCNVGNILQETVDCTKDGYHSFYSDQSSTSISASTIQYNWKTGSSEIVSPLIIESSVHRIYSTKDVPAPGSPSTPYIEMLELATSLASGINSCSSAMPIITNSIYNNSLSSINNPYFMDVVNNFKYDSTITIYHSDMVYSPGPAWLFPHASINFYLKELLSDLEDKYHGIVQVDCYGSALFNATIIRTIGCPMKLYNLDIEGDIVEGIKSFGLRRNWPQGWAQEEIGLSAGFDSHFVASSLEGEIYDATLKLSFSDQTLIDLNCLGQFTDDRCFFPANSIDKNSYKQFLADMPESLEYIYTFVKVDNQ